MGRTACKEPQCLYKGALLLLPVTDLLCLLLYHETQAVKTEDKPGNVIYESWEDLQSQQRLDNNEK